MNVTGAPSLRVDAFGHDAETRWPSTEGEVLVPLRIDGTSYAVGLRIDHDEHARRQVGELAAVVSTGLLHALWMLPRGVPVVWAALSEIDQDTIDVEGCGWVERSGPWVTRCYTPAGVVASLLVTHASLSRAIARAAAHPPTVRRIVRWERTTKGRLRPDPLQLSRAQTLGIGVYVHDPCSGECVELVAPAEALRGLPAVFRWWQAELAYRNWLMRRPPTAPAAIWE